MSDSPPPPPPPPPPQRQQGEKDGKAEEGSLTDCLLSQYRFCAAGIGLGTAYSLKLKKGLVPMIAAGALGTTADMVYGYLVECAHLAGSADDNSPAVATGTGTTFRDTPTMGSNDESKR
eukprot:CAMPEP_0172395616 /NCGR_PEP_ID=MMETSP1061-20121228/20635_1 /TAXON_ID=37318 /ORGANISM="Pseudo-nitzschia pungens, Strain cf. pungens" /LENGTH=118 /DNA_ID=CAMNT_0013127257 /DNA_START=116 /DNA_END=472 /DNA_ORIENTATION=+